MVAPSGGSATSARKAPVVNPERLRKFIDSPSSSNPGRVRHAAEVKAETKVRSWDGELCDHRPFESRLAPADHVIAGTDRRAPRLLGTEAVPASGLLVEKHVELREGTIKDPESGLYAPVMVQHDGFKTRPEIAHVSVPSSVYLREEGLMNPAQRRERLEFETTYHQARRAMEQKERDERRLHQLVKARHVTNDVLNRDAGENHLHRQRGESYKADLLRHEMHPRPGLPREYQKKADHATPKMNTHERIFNETPVYWDPNRAQYLRNEGHAGRPCDIVNGGVVTYFPPSIPEKQHPRQAHPSVIAHPYTR